MRLYLSENILYQLFRHEYRSHSFSLFLSQIYWYQHFYFKVIFNHFTNIGDTRHTKVHEGGTFFFGNLCAICFVGGCFFHTKPLSTRRSTKGKPYCESLCFWGIVWKMYCIRGSILLLNLQKKWHTICHIFKINHGNRRNGSGINGKTAKLISCFSFQAGIKTALRIKL